MKTSAFSIVSQVCLLFVLMALPALATEMRLEVSNNSPSIDDFVKVTVVADLGSELAAGVSTVIKLDTRLTVSGISYSSAASTVIPVDEEFTGEELILAAYFAPGDCTGDCILASFFVKAEVAGTFQLQILDKGTNSIWGTASKQLSPFAKYTDATITIADQPAHPSDTNGDMAISLSEATSYAAKFVRDELSISLSEATRFAAIFVNGGCYAVDPQDSIGFVSSPCR
jgi:hypothetical protein